MDIKAIRPEDKLDFFADLMSCGGDCYLWAYDTKGEFIASNSGNNLFHKLFLKSGLMDYLLEYIKENSDPIILSIPYGLMWGAAFQKDANGNIKRIYLNGPVTTQELSRESVAYMVNHSEVTPSWRPKFRKYLREIPYVMASYFFRQTIMMNYCVTGKKLDVADIRFYRTDAGEKKTDTSASNQDRLQTYMAEQELLRMVREGDLNYKKALQRAVSVSSGVGTNDPDALRHAKLSQVVFTTLCTRAAIEGGLSPETAYSKGDGYIQDVMNCSLVSDTVHLGHTMYEDFIQAVNRRKQQTNYSPAVQSCCDYIATHLEKEIELDDLAKRIGYSKYYLSRVFKNETGKSIKEYTRDARIEKAKFMLENTHLSIQEISDRLCFGTRSFFADSFAKAVGMPPAAYRKNHQKL